MQDNEDSGSEPEVDSHVKKNNEFTIEELRECWNEFLDRKKEEGGMETELMVLRQPYELDGTIVTLHLSNAFQADLLMKFHTDLSGHLRKNLQNRSIQVLHEVKEELREQLLYTNTEKFEHLKKINPKLGDLSERLGLDPEF